MTCKIWRKIGLARDVNGRDRDETLVRLETVSRPRRRDRDHNPACRLPEFICLFYLRSQTKAPQRIQLKAGVIAADLTCGPFPGPGSSSERRASMNPMHEFIHHHYGHVEDAFHRFKKAHNKNYRDRATHEKRKQNFRHNLRLVAPQ